MSSWTRFRDRVLGAGSTLTGLHGENVLAVSHNVSPVIALGKERQSIANPVPLYSMLRDLNKETITSQVSSDIKTGHVGSLRRLEHKQTRPELRHKLYPMFVTGVGDAFTDAVIASIGDTYLTNINYFAVTDYYADPDNGPDPTNPFYLHKKYTDSVNLVIKVSLGDGDIRPSRTQPEIDALPFVYIVYYLGSEDDASDAINPHKMRVLIIPKNDVNNPLSVWYQDPAREPFKDTATTYKTIADVPVGEIRDIYPLIPFKLNDRFLRKEAPDTLEHYIYSRVKAVDTFSSESYKHLADDISEFTLPEPVRSMYDTDALFNTAHDEWEDNKAEKIKADSQTRHTVKSYATNILRTTTSNAEVMFRHLEFYADNFTSKAFSVAGTGWTGNEGLPLNNHTSIEADQGYLHTFGFWTRQEMRVSKDDGTPITIVNPDTGVPYATSNAPTTLGLEGAYVAQYTKASTTTLRKEVIGKHGVKHELAEGEYYMDISWYDGANLVEEFITLTDGRFPVIHDENWHRTNTHYAGLDTPYRINVYRGTKTGYDVIRIHSFNFTTYASKAGQTKSSQVRLVDFFVTGKSDKGAMTLPLYPSVIAACRFSAKYRTYQESSHLIHSYAVITYLKWYETEHFAKLLQIVTTVYTIATLGTGAGLQAFITALVQQVIVQVVVAVAFKYALEHMPDSPFARILAVVLAVVVTIYTQDAEALVSMSAIEVSLLVVQIASKFTNYVLEQEMLEEAEDADEDQNSYDKWEKDYLALTALEGIDDEMSAATREATRMMLFEDASDAIDRSLDLETIDRSYDMMMEQVFDLDKL